MVHNRDLSGRSTKTYETKFEPKFERLPERWMQNVSSHLLFNQQLLVYIIFFRHFGFFLFLSDHDFKQ
jgi:hypothetical protein